MQLLAKAPRQSGALVKAGGFGPLNAGVILKGQQKRRDNEAVLHAAKAADAQKRAADREAAAINIVQTCGPVETWTKAKLRTFLKCKGVKKVDTIKDKAELQRLVKDVVHTQQN